MVRFLVSLTLLFLCTTPAFAAEVKNDLVRQEGNRVAVTYDLEGSEGDAQVTVTVRVGGTVYAADRLHLEGDVGKVRTGKGKRVWWNVLQDFPRGLSGDVEVTVTAGGGAFKDPVTGMEFVAVPGGCYQMGDTFGDGESDEKPVHEVCVSDFAIGKYEVTQGEWRTVMGNNPSGFSSCGDDCPVEQVSWNDVEAFIEKLNSRTGKNYRLPTDAEWEYAARSGGKREKYSGGDNVDSVAWYNGNSGNKTHPVGQKAPNGLGIYDMSGNVWEWCQDWYGYKYYETSPKSNPQGPSSGSYRVDRGGGWYSIPRYVRASYRLRGEPGLRSFILGFRLSAPVQ
jgi:formylglycine-generating enzyme